MYASFMRAPYAYPAKFGFFLAAWAYLCTHYDTPVPGTREINPVEYGATPPEYLVHPSMHPKLLSRVTGEATVADARGALFAKHGRKDDNPSVPHGHH